MSISQNFPAEGPNLNLNFTHSRILDSRVSFTRTSSATLVNENGMVATVPAGIPRFDHRVTITENLQLYSEQFNISPTWGTTNTTVTANQAVAPDGSTTADLITASVTGNDRLLRQGVTVPANSFTYTGSIYVKRSTYRYFSFGLFFSGGTTQESLAVVDLDAGTIGNSANAPTQLLASSFTITALSDGWYRISVTQTNNGTNTSVNMSLRPLNHNSPELVASNAFIWGAQLEVGSTATTYIPTTNVKVESIDVESMGILVEEQRTNIVLQSQNFNTSPNIIANATLTANATLAPDGTMTASKLVEDSVLSQFKRVQQSSIATITGAYTVSCFFKAAEVYVGYLQLLNTTNAYVTFNLNEGRITSSIGTNPTIEKYPNGWYRISVTNTFTNETPSVYIVLSNPSGSANYTGNGVNGMFVWGLQVEQGAFATSYIPTTTATVTRTPDIYSISGTNYSKWFNPLEGSIVVECENTGTKSNQFSTPFGLRATLPASDPTLEVFQNNGRFYYLVRIATGNDAVGIDVPLSSQVGRYIKYGHTYKADDFSYRINGTLYTDTSGALPTGLIVAAIGSNNATYMNGRIKSIAYYPYRLSNQFLTSLVP
jgi:hypothetical protein